MLLTKSLRTLLSVGGIILIAIGCTPAAVPTPLPPTAIPSTPTPVEEKYEAVATADYEPNMELSGRIEWDQSGLVTGGPVDSFSFWGQKIELTSNMITDGVLSTRDYGKIMIKVNPNGSMHIELTPSQQEKIKQLKK
jgi:hypothetical protein